MVSRVLFSECLYIRRRKSESPREHECDVYVYDVESLRRSHSRHVSPPPPKWRAPACATWVVVSEEIQETLVYARGSVAGTALPPFLYTEGSAAHTQFSRNSPVVRVLDT